MTTALTGPDPRHFVIEGVIAVWEPSDRVLQIGEHTFWVAPDVSVTGLAIGVTVMVAGHQDVDARRVVTRLTLG